MWETFRKVCLLSGLQGKDRKLQEEKETTYKGR